VTKAKFLMIHQSRGKIQLNCESHYKDLDISYE
jgi:hypothetical protein